MVSLYGLFPLVCYTIGAILFSRFKLDESAYETIRIELDARRAQAQAEASGSAQATGQ
jgi:Na+/melibiose symporter-like transporter